MKCLIDQVEFEISRDIPTAIDLVKSQRNVLLTKSDWTQLPDTRLTSEERATWAAYRESLRSFVDNNKQEIINGVASDYLVINFPAPPQE